MIINGTEKGFTIDTGSGSPISIKPADDTILKKTDVQKVKHRYRDVNQNEVKFCGQIPGDMEYENNKQKIQILITERNVITPLRGMDWMRKLNLAIRKNNQSEKRRVF